MLSAPSPHVVRPAPGFSARDLMGRDFALSNVEGHVTVLFIWAAWHCTDELAALDDIATRLKPLDTPVIAVSIDREAENVRRVARTRNRWTLAFLHDPSGHIARAYDPGGFPAAYVIDATGTIRHAYYGVCIRTLRTIEADARALSLTWRKQVTDQLAHRGAHHPAGFDAPVTALDRQPTEREGVHAESVRGCGKARRCAVQQRPST